MNQQVTEYINQAEPEQRKVMEILRKLIHQVVPDVKEEFKWSRPVFSSSINFAYFKTTKMYFTLGFSNFHKLNDSNNLLQGTGKDMRHIKIKNVGEIDENLLKEWFIAASK